MVTANIISRVFNLKNNNSFGTCFTLDIDKRQYLLTAKHIVNELTVNSTLEILHNKEWKSLKVENIHHCDDMDVSIVAINVFIPSLPVSATIAQLSYGQDIYFLGFPLGLYSNVGEINRHFPLPFIKKGIISAIDFEGNYLLIDGYNNKGFSGAPVVFRHYPYTSNEYYIAGIISSYKPEYSKVYIAQQETDLISEMNSGIITAYSITKVIQTIKILNFGKIIPS